MSLSSYLASKYLNAEPARGSTSKKRKRKQLSSTTGLIIADDTDLLGFSNSPSLDDPSSDIPLTISSNSAEFRRAKKDAWKSVGAPPPTTTDQASLEADAIIASAAAENSAHNHQDEAPTIEDDPTVVKMGDGTHAGLQTAASVTAQMERRKKEELARWEAESSSHSKSKKRVAGKGDEEETVYRDATGRRIDISMRRAAARAEATAALSKEKLEAEASKGEYQLAQKAKRREELDEARFMPLARTVEDEEMNREMKEVERWNDPAAQFLVRKRDGKSVSGRPLYKGAAAPNRYGIRPGHRWDGVDRGNGWEGERFKAMNRRTRNKELDFAWQMDE